MASTYGLLSLDAPVGKGQENRPDDVERLENALREIGAYTPPPEYADGPQRYATEPLIDALDLLQEKNGLKTDGIVNPGGPTERAINNRLLNKPRGAGLLNAPAPSIADTVGNGFKNNPFDVASVQRRLGALGYMPEDPFDDPPGFIDERTTSGMKRFQLDKGLMSDGWMAPGGETEQTLEDSIADLARAKGRVWLDHARRIERMESELTAGNDIGFDDEDGVALVRSPPSPPPPIPPPPTTGGPSPRPTHPIRPDLLPPSVRDLRNPEALRREAQRPIPGALSGQIPQMSPPRREVRLSIHDIDRVLGLPPGPSIEEEARRELTIPRKPATPLPNTYVPEPGSPLAIPIIDYNPGGRRGDPRTVQATEELADTIEKACKEVFPDATFTKKFEKYFPKEKSTTRGSSYADGWMEIRLPGSILIEVVSDTYTPNADTEPNAGERRRYAQLQHNMQDRNRVIVRMPKPWALGQEINKEKLAEFTKELFEQIKNKLDKGTIGPGKDWLQWERFFKELVKAKAKAKEAPRKQE